MRRRLPFCLVLWSARKGLTRGSDCPNSSLANTAAAPLGGCSTLPCQLPRLAGDFVSRHDSKPRASDVPALRSNRERSRNFGQALRCQHPAELRLTSQDVAALSSSMG